MIKVDGFFREEVSWWRQRQERKVIGSGEVKTCFSRRLWTSLQEGTPIRHDVIDSKRKGNNGIPRRIPFFLKANNVTWSYRGKVYIRYFCPQQKLHLHSNEACPICPLEGISFHDELASTMFQCSMEGDTSHVPHCLNQSELSQLSGRTIVK